MGGRAKTPVVAWLARTLIGAGFRPAILSRGYAARSPADGAVIVSDGRHIRADLDRSGDEPLMLARMLPGTIVVVSPDRRLAGRIAERVLGADVLILDDGFQHRRLERDVDVVIVAPADLDAKRLPFGPLRESPRALRRADAILIDGVANGGGAEAARQIGQHTQAPIFTVARYAGSPVELEPDRWHITRGQRVIAVAGIVEPERFGRALRDAGWDVAEVIGFRDHHSYRPADLARIQSALAATGASAVLTTEKDAVRLLPLRPLGMPIAAVPLVIEIGPQGTFDSWLLSRLRERRQ